MSRLCQLLLATLLVCTRAYEAAHQVLEPEETESEDVMATLSCSFPGNPPPKISWRFEAEIGHIARRYRQTEDGSLVICPLHRSDSGVYTCVADNGLEVATQHVHLVVDGDVDCGQYEECENLQHCDFGVEKTIDADGCERCQCKQNPCKMKSCSEGSRCVLQKTMPSSDQETLFSAECIAKVKAGACPADVIRPYNDTCPQECADDADCRGVGKCCRRGCGLLCLAPATQSNTNYFFLQQFIFPAFVPVSTIKPEFPEIRKSTTPPLKIHEDSTTDEVITDVTSAGEVTTDATGAGEVITDVTGAGEVTTVVTTTNEGTTVVTGTDRVTTNVTTTTEGITDVTGSGEVTTDVTTTNEGTTVVTGTGGVTTDVTGAGEVTTDVNDTGEKKTNVTGTSNDIEAGLEVSLTSVVTSPAPVTSVVTPPVPVTTVVPSFVAVTSVVTSPALVTSVITSSVVLSSYICQLPMLQGPCGESLMRWFYDASTDSCSQFTYGGCEGNDNSFESLEACENRCRTGPAPVAPTTPTTTTIVSGPPECRVTESLEECRYGGLVWYFEPSSHACVSHSNQESGVNCRYTGTFLSEEVCERSCGAFLGVDVCKQPLDPGPCQSYVPKVYFDQSTGQCHEFIYGGCLGGANRFSSFKECSQVCKTEIEVCSLPPDQGDCSLNVKQWYYNATSHECYQFAYTGCSGNDNRFDTERDCEAHCKRPASTTTTVAPRQQQPTEPECRTPSSLAPCGNNVTVFYYDSERAQCLVSGFGGCGHANTYSTEEECERRCGAFRGIDVCGARLDPGPCRASIPKFYWDVASGSCQPYAYGGCAGGPNRFSTVEECMDLCGATGIDSDQMLPTDCTSYQQECEALDCPYGVDRFTQDECQRCECREDPCIRADCQPTERCEAVAIRNPVSQEPEYSAKCVYENTEVHQCDEYVANCSRLRCEYGIQRTRQHDGCEQCSCVQVESDCEPLQQECTQLKCNYGIERITGPEGCERCKCKEDPCERKSCAVGERCVVQQYVLPGFQPERQFKTECRTIVKAGACPMDETTTDEDTCHRECADDAHCRGQAKCCRRGCSDVCLAPVEQTSPRPLLTTTTASSKNVW
ncbi:hypothetical protein PYW07_008099 [Mythimna separata]|uniref:Papilin n=1 Tax=Mythimna separata TaxID=271217 RepID=A0AAD7YQS2_MYTSE|nr:hypothetical protein PYW07_008099 [Mythimna separata]